MREVQLRDANATLSALVDDAVNGVPDSKIELRLTQVGSTAQHPSIAAP